MVYNGKSPTKMDDLGVCTPRKPPFVRPLVPSIFESPIEIHIIPTSEDSGPLQSLPPRWVITPAWLVLDVGIQDQKHKKLAKFRNVAILANK
jgi:hypothetical protein